MNWKAIAFDMYDTLCFISKPTHPYHKLLQASDFSLDEAARLVMANDFSLAEMAKQISRSHEIDIAAIEEEIAREVESVQLFPEVLETLQNLKQLGCRLCLISNLTAPYAAPIYTLLPEVFEQHIWSFELGTIKPDATIYQVLCERMELLPGEILMVGDSIKADVEGAQRFGMSAVHLDRFAPSRKEGNITSLHELMSIIESNSATV